MEESWVYLLRCGDGSFYAGWTCDPRRRLRAHQTGRGARYTRSHPPVELAYLEKLPDRHSARVRECGLKKLTHRQKERLAEEWAQKEKEHVQL